MDQPTTPLALYKTSLSSQTQQDLLSFVFLVAILTGWHGVWEQMVCWHLLTANIKNFWQLFFFFWELPIQCSDPLLEWMTADASLGISSQMIGILPFLVAADLSLTIQGCLFLWWLLFCCEKLFGFYKSRFWIFRLFPMPLESSSKTPSLCLTILQLCFPQAMSKFHLLH